MDNAQREWILSVADEYDTKQELYEAFKEQYPDSPTSYATLTRELRKKSWSESARTGTEKRGRPVDEGLSCSIQALLAAEPKLSARQIAERLHRPVSTIKYQLRHVLGYQFMKTRWIPHTLTDKQRDARVRDSRALLKTLEDAEKNNLHFFVTGDESWFFYESPNNGLWMPPDSRAPQAQKRSHYAPKTMITVFWNIDGALVVEALPAAMTWTADYFVESILSKIVESEPFQRSRRQKQKFIVHMDNAPVHTAATVKRMMTENNLCSAPHPPYSPDLAPSDFYLFGTLKSRIKGIEFATSEEIKEWILEQMQMTSKAEYKRVFQLWKARLQACIDIGGHYVE